MIQEKMRVGNVEIANRVVIQPMEGCDCLENGAPSELTVNKYLSFAKSGAGIIWFEACAVCKEGRTNVRQMNINEGNVDAFTNLLKDIRGAATDAGFPAPKLILQLTHSGRQSIVPMIAYRNEVYEAKRPMKDEYIVSDEYLDTLPEKFAKAAQLAVAAGFDGIDMKSCHGYLLQELLSAYNREGKYGGSFENRTRCYLQCFDAIKAVVPKDFILAARIGLSDMVQKPFGFGTDEQGNLDLTEAKRFVQILTERGLKLLNVTIGNPYFNPHINRPFRVGPYKAPESAETGLKRFYDVEKEMKKTFPDLPIVGSGVSYYKNDLMEQAEKLLCDGACDFVGFGRNAIAYPEFYVDYLAGKFDGKKCCVTCSKCTTLMRNGCVSGCATFNEYYKDLFKREKL
ncbi:MAG: flavin oxidoreductase/NADH oxidase [Clostridiales bacterium]|nr:flavin oxidoreductase/NADH oxidase [Clostridiales bacterium]